MAGGKMIYLNYTRYGGAVSHADSTWSSLGKVNIYPKPSNSSNWNLTINEYNQNDGLCGKYALGEIKLNVYYFANYNDWNRKSCVSHEFGHALGIGDHDEEYNCIALLYKVVGCFISPQSHDKKDYYDRWQ
ncbi:hypothetical protein [Thermobaculum terrenum]|nr:hypothetical protein [Thermobaculum terrenum]